MEECAEQIKKAIQANRYSVREVFKACDTSGTGALSKVEFCTGMRRLVPELADHDDRVNELFWAVDTDHTYKVSYNQFVEMFRLETKGPAEDSEELKARTDEIMTLVTESGSTLVDVFKAFDVTESNYISRKELKAGLEKLGIGGPLGIPEVDLVAVMGRMDVTGDGLIHYSEFVKRKGGPGPGSTEELSEQSTSGQNNLISEIKKAMEDHQYSHREVFKTIDSSGTGLLSKQEFCDGMSKLVPLATKEDLHELFLSVDVDHTYKISYSQFVERFRFSKKRPVFSQEAQEAKAQFLLDKMHKSGENDLVQVFKQFDLTESNFISKKELKIGLENLGVCGPLGVSEADLSALMGLLDKTGNGIVGYTEFVKPASDSSRRRRQVKQCKESEDNDWMAETVSQIKARIILYGYSMKDVFDAFDTSGTGKLSKTELKEGLELLVPDLSLSDDRFDQLFRKIDSIHTYRVDFTQFVQHFRVQHPEDRRQSIGSAFQRNVQSMITTMMSSTSEREELFRRFDKSNTGYISRKELKEGLEELGLGGPLGVARACTSGVMKILDKRGNGYITKEDIISHH